MTNFSCYDYGAEFSIYRRKKHILFFVYKTVWLIYQNLDNATKYFHNPPHLWTHLQLFVNSTFQANRYGLVSPMNTEPYPHIDYLLFCIFNFNMKEMVAYSIKSLIYNRIV